MAKRKVEMVTKAELVELVATESEFTNKDTEKFLKALTNVGNDILVSGKGFRLKDLGSFGLTDREARIGRLPATGQEIEIPASVNVSFKVSKTLKDNLNGR